MDPLFALLVFELRPKRLLAATRRRLDVGKTCHSFPKSHWVFPWFFCFLSWRGTVSASYSKIDQIKPLIVSPPSIDCPHFVWAFPLAYFTEFRTTFMGWRLIFISAQPKWDFHGNKSIGSPQRGWRVDNPINLSLASLLPSLSLRVWMVGNGHQSVGGHNWGNISYVLDVMNQSIGY